ncbi:uncharacterized protein LOC18048718 [Citrus clementina]|uniref:uncharacterized protein LOC18048718 n=1 Tax=Citrus clementina TaxID=85681 RepID=UPI000CED5274|nr:uncharacterized protein LOC18048718 [Citrus x clementina]
MEALWNLEDKWKLTTRESLLLFVCAAVAVVGLCTVTILQRKAQKTKVVDVDDGPSKSVHVKLGEPSCGWVSIKRMLMSSVRWSVQRSGRTEDVLRVAERSHNSASPVWQRPILMGEKCELPRFSGLILYDERGKPLHHSLKAASYKDDIHQEKSAAVVRTTLKDLL